MPTIDQRAGDALSALYEYLSIKGELTIKPIEPEHITDLVADLLHLAQKQGFAPGEIAASGLMHFEAESVPQNPADYPVCATCGSEDVTLDVIAHWDKAAGEAHVINICEKGHICDSCGETRLNWIEPGQQGP